MLQKDIKVVGEFTPEYVFNNFIDPTVYRNDKNIDVTVYHKNRSIDVETEHGVFSVYVNSQRYVLFNEKGCTCTKCGITAKKVYLCDTGGGRAHFNFIVEINGEDFLLTKDHVEAKSSGGANIQKNYVPMCQRCNMLKGSLPNAVFNIYTPMIKQAESENLFNFVFKAEGILYICNKKKGKWVQPQPIKYFKDN